MSNETNSLKDRGYYMEGGDFMQPEPPYYNNKPLERVPVSNIINITAKAKLSLEVTLFNVDSKKDVTVTLELGKKYKIKNVTQFGSNEFEGVLTAISNTMPIDKTIKFIGNHNDVTDFSYVILDCSKENLSNVNKIYIQDIRDIEEVVEDNDAVPDDETSL